jgi:hypothetical protein
VTGGAAASTDGAGGAATIAGGAAKGTGAGGAASLTGGASEGAAGTAGGVVIDAGAPTGGTGAAVSIAPTNATGVEIGKDVTLATTTKMQFRDTGLFVQSADDGKLTISSDGVGADDIILAGTVTVNDNLTMAADKNLLLQGTGKLSLAGTTVDASAAELNTLDGIAATVDELNQLAESVLTAVGNLTAKRFVGSDLSIGDVDDLAVIGVSPAAITAAAAGVVQAFGFALVTADAPLALGEPVKVGVGGRATKHTTAQHTLDTEVTGESTAFTQPGSATEVEVVQAADVEADRGREIVIEGSDALGVAITETIALDASNTTTPTAGLVEFTKISGAYMADGAVLGAQDVTIQASPGGASIVVMTGGTSEVGADIPAQSAEAYCNEISVLAGAQDATFVTIVGTDSADAEARERAQLDNATPGKIATTTVFRTVDRICLGELTNALTASVKTNITTDTAGMKCGVVVGAAAARDDDATILLKPNA